MKFLNLFNLTSFSSVLVPLALQSTSLSFSYALILIGYPGFDIIGLLCSEAAMLPPVFCSVFLCSPLAIWLSLDIPYIAVMEKPNLTWMFLFQQASDK